MKDSKGASHISWCRALVIWFWFSVVSFRICSSWENLHSQFLVEPKVRVSRSCVVTSSTLWIFNKVGGWEERVNCAHMRENRLHFIDEFTGGNFSDILGMTGTTTTSNLSIIITCSIVYSLSSTMLLWHAFLYGRQFLVGWMTEIKL